MGGKAKPAMTHAVRKTSHPFPPPDVVQLWAKRMPEGGMVSASSACPHFVCWLGARAVAVGLALCAPTVHREGLVVRGRESAGAGERREGERERKRERERERGRDRGRDETETETEGREREREEGAKGEKGEKGKGVRRHELCPGTVAGSDSSASALAVPRLCC